MEPHKAVAALETRFVAKRHAALFKLMHGPRAHDVIDAVNDCAGMTAAAKTFAVSVKDKRDDIFHAVFFHLRRKV